MKDGGCGILEQYIQLALTNLFNCISFLAFIHTQNASVSCFIFLIDLPWSDNNNLYLGTLTVALQVLDPSPQSNYPREEKRGGGAHPLQPSFRSLNPRF